MCCLRYEQEFYEEMMDYAPKVNEDIMTPEGMGTVMDVNVIKESVRAKLLQEDGSYEVKGFSFKGDRTDKQRRL